MQDQRDHSEHEKEVNQSSRYVKDRKAAQPSYQQNHKQNRPDAHFCSSIIFQINNLKTVVDVAKIRAATTLCPRPPAHTIRLYATSRRLATVLLSPLASPVEETS
jgi:hypothetical protein